MNKQTCRIESYAFALSRTQLFGPNSISNEVKSSSPVDVFPVDCAQMPLKSEPCVPATVPPLPHGRAPLNRSRVRMGARTVQNMAMYGESSVRGRPGRAFSSSDLLGEKKDHGDEVLDTQEAVVLTPRSLQSRAKSHSHILSSGKAPEIGVKSIFKGKGPDHPGDHQMNKELKKKKKDESKVGKFFKRIKKLVRIKEEKDDEDEMNFTKKMTRSFSCTLEKSKNLPKRLRSLNISSVRLNQDNYID